MLKQIDDVSPQEVFSYLLDGMTIYATRIVRSGGYAVVTFLDKATGGEVYGEKVDILNLSRRGGIAMENAAIKLCQRLNLHVYEEKCRTNKQRDSGDWMSRLHLD